jgi:hypothetical protein
VHHLMSMGSSANCRPPSEAPRLVAVVATLSKGYDLDYIWTQVDRGAAKDAASYYLQASESGGEPAGRWWGPGAETLGLTIRPDSWRMTFSSIAPGPGGTPLPGARWQPQGRGGT